MDVVVIDHRVRSTVDYDSVTAASDIEVLSKKDFEAARLGVFAIPGPLHTLLNCGIRVESIYYARVIDPLEESSGGTE